MQAMRPRFRMELPFDRAELQRRFGANLACKGCPAEAVFTDNHVDVRIRGDLQHFWSPHLSLEVDDGEEGNAVLHGLFGPNAGVWTMFMAAYCALAFIAFMGAMFGWSQLAIGASPTGLLVIPAAAILALVPYAGSLYGQRLAADQMEMLRCFLESSVGVEHVPVDAPECPEPALRTA